MNIEKEDYPEYIRKLGESAGTEIKDLASFEGAGNVLIILRTEPASVTTGWKR